MLYHDPLAYRDQYSQCSQCEVFKEDKGQRLRKNKQSEARLTWPCAVVSRGVADEACCAQLAAGPRRVVDAAEALASLGMTKLAGTLRICVPAAVTGDAASGRPEEEAGAALVTLRPTVVGKALVAHWGATGIWTGTAGRAETQSEVNLEAGNYHFFSVDDQHVSFNMSISFH